MQGHCKWMTVVLWALVLFLGVGRGGRYNINGGGGRRTRAQFSYTDFYQNNFPPERNSGLTPNGVRVRQASNPAPIVSQFAASAFDNITCDFRRRIWNVTWAIVNEAEGLGVPFTYVLAQCQTDTARFVLSEASEQIVTYMDAREIGLSQLFGLTSPESDSITQIVVACTFQLFLAFQREYSVPAQLVDVYPHYCDTSDNVTAGFYDLSTKINSDTYQGSAIFWYMIYGVTIIVSFVGYAIYLLFTWHGRHSSYKQLQIKNATVRALDREHNLGIDPGLQNIPDIELRARREELQRLKGLVESDASHDKILGYVDARSPSYGGMYRTSGRMRSASGKPGNGEGEKSGSIYSKTQGIRDRGNGTSGRTHSPSTYGSRKTDGGDDSLNLTRGSEPSHHIPSYLQPAEDITQFQIVDPKSINNRQFTSTTQTNIERSLKRKKDEDSEGGWQSNNT